MNEARCEFYQNFIEENGSNQRNLFAAVWYFLFVMTSLNLQTKWELASSNNIHSKLDEMAQGLPNVAVGFVSETTVLLNDFTTLSEVDVRKLLEACAKKVVLLIQCQRA